MGAEMKYVQTGNTLSAKLGFEIENEQAHYTWIYKIYTRTLLQNVKGNRKCFIPGTSCSKATIPVGIMCLPKMGIV